MFKIRPATIQDAEEIVSINVLCWKIAYRGIVDDMILDKMNVSEKRIERCKNTILSSMILLVAEQDKKVVGYIALDNGTDLPYPYELKWLYIHPKYQGLGIGKKLFTEVRKITQKKPFYVYMLDGNSKALQFYLKMGGIRYPQYDTDKLITNFTTHDLCLVFPS